MNIQLISSGNWTIDPTTTSVTASVANWGFLTVRGTFSLTEGTISVNADGLPEYVTASVDSASFSTGNRMRDDHVRAADFLDADQFPTLSLTLDALQQTGGDTFTASGLVNVKGKQTPVSFTISKVNVEGTKATFDAFTTVDRRELGVTKGPAFMIGNEVALTISAQATLQS